MAGSEVLCCLARLANEELLSIAVMFEFERSQVRGDWLDLKTLKIVKGSQGSTKCEDRLEGFDCGKR